jgi:hypothetical protein
MENTKVCCRCGKTKQLNEMVSGRTQCKKCHANWMVEWRKNNLELNREIQKQNYERKKLKQN